MKIIGVKKIKQRVFKNSKGDLLKFVSKKNNFFKSFGEIYFNEINLNKKKGWILHKKNQCIFTVVYGEVAKSGLIKKLSIMNKKIYN